MAPHLWMGFARCHAVARCPSTYMTAAEVAMGLNTGAGRAWECGPSTLEPAEAGAAFRRVPASGPRAVAPTPVGACSTWPWEPSECHHGSWARSLPLWYLTQSAITKTRAQFAVWGCMAHGEHTVCQQHHTNPQSGSKGPVAEGFASLGYKCFSRSNPSDDHTNTVGGLHQQHTNTVGHHCALFTLLPRAVIAIVVPACFAAVSR